jgi:glycosyltransferase involved in cell wall biosynthesis
MISKSFGYYAIIDEHKFKGVINKINDTVDAASELGFDSKAHVYEENLKGVLKFFWGLLTSKFEINYIRYSVLPAPILFFICLYLRLMGKKIIIDIPTPRTAALKELKLSKKSFLFKHVSIVVLTLSGSWVLLSANLIIQYSNESNWFRFGLGQKTLKVGNGIFIKPNIPTRTSVWPNSELVLIAVAGIAQWHGFDRVIRAIHTVKKDDLGFNIKFIIVGDGNEKKALELLVNKLELTENVLFKGALTGRALDSAFYDAHIGVSSLGLYRKGLTSASDLKTREYMARGLCVLAAGEDTDFGSDSPYRIVVKNDDSIHEIEEVFRTFRKRKLPEPDDVRAFAISHLAMNVKLHKIIDNLL